MCVCVNVSFRAERGYVDFVSIRERAMVWLDVFSRGALFREERERDFFTIYARVVCKFLPLLWAVVDSLTILSRSTVGL